MQQLTRAVCVAALLALAARTASAHGGLFRPDELRLDPTDPAHLVVRSDVWGLVESRDTGASWQWVCAEGIGGQSVVVERNPFVVLPGGAVLAGAGFGGLFRSQGSLCEAAPVPFFAEAGRCGTNDCLPVAIAPESTTLPRALVLTAGRRGAEYANLLFRTTDGGATWAALPESLPTDLFATGVAVAHPSVDAGDAGTIYVTASTVVLPLGFVLLRSRDDGQSWSRTILPLSTRPGEPPITVRLHGVSPDDPETVFIWADADSGDRTVLAPDRLLVSTDGGTSAKLAFVAKDDLPGFTISPDGATVFVGGVVDGLLSAPMTAMTATALGSDAGSSFRVVNAAPTWALAFTADGLLAGRQDYGDPSAPRMSLGLSRDLGAAFEPALVVCDVGPMACPAASRTATECGGLFHGTSNFEYDQQSRRCGLDDAGAGAPDGGKSAGGTGTDGGASRGPSSTAKATGCGCRAAKDGEAHGPWALAIAVAIAAAARRQRRDSRVCG